MKKILKTGADFTPCPVDTGDELFPNGIFVFNITKLLEYIHNNRYSVPLEEVAGKDFWKDYSFINESYVDSIEISELVVMAEISPERYNLIDGHHRMEKARRLGIYSIRAYKLAAEQHVRFLISEKAYVAFVEYWNRKLKERAEINRSFIKNSKSMRSS